MQSLLTYKNLKALELKPNGRSSDYIFPTLIMGCGFKCYYCTCRRYKPEGLDISQNIDTILNSVDLQTRYLPWPKVATQCDPNKYTLDLGCNTDFSLLSKKYINWEHIFDWFKDRPRLKATFATKYINTDFLNYDPEDSIRIRFSLMPQKLSSIMEPGTSLIEDRINAINTFIEAGYEVHLNFSPVIWYNSSNYIKRYIELFQQIDDVVNPNYKPFIKAEVIFLTHNKLLHEYNLEHEFKYEHLLWNPDIQENKVTSYGGNAVRYNYKFKYKLVNEFKEVHGRYLSWNTIRYIF